MPSLPFINEILQSGKLSYGKYGKEFEKSLSEFIGNPNIIVTNSFNMAILVVLSTLNITAGNEVIVSPMACLSSTQPLRSIGVKIKWADVDPLTGTLCPDSVKKSISINTKAIIHNHFCGYVGYVNEINSIGKEFGIPIIDDCIEAFGSEYKSKLTGNLDTNITVFSFNTVRIPNTIEGGAIVFNDINLYKKSLMVRDAGIDRNKFRDELGEINPNYDITIVGYNATMSEINAYIGLQQMKNISKILSIQRSNAKFWDKKFLDIAEIRPVYTPECLPNYWVYGILTKNKRESIIKFRNEGYYASGVHIKNNIYSVFGNKSLLSGVNEFDKSFIALPSGWWLNLLKK